MIGILFQEISTAKGSWPNHFLHVRRDYIRNLVPHHIISVPSFRWEPGFGRTLAESLPMEDDLSLLLLPCTVPCGALALTYNIRGSVDKDSIII